VAATVAGRCYTTGRTQRGVQGHRCWLPLSDGPRRLGVLGIIGGSPDLAAGQRLADLLALLITSRQSFSDLIERTRRRQPMGLAAEVVWSLLPPVTVQTPELTVSGVLEPCYQVGGDAFDYAVNGRTAHWAIFDAMGHGVAASLQATVAVNGYRNARRAGLSLADTYRSIDEALRQTHPDAFVTAVLAELDLDSGALRYITAGHPAPMLLRDGGLAHTLQSPTAMPLGLATSAPPRLAGDPVCIQPLSPGDQVLSYTDGVVEARDGDGAFFGMERLVDFVGRALLDETSTAETLRLLIHAILSHQHDRLQDDAGALLVHWHPGRHTTGVPVHRAATSP
jgi:serine phosphatase RsbU (regulator of sigma subunit)